MKDILLINGKIALAFAIFYAVYKLFLSNDTFFVRNRFYLLGAMLVSLVSPLLKFHKTVVVPALFNTPIVTNIDNPVIQPVTQPVNYWPMVIGIAIGIYFLGVMFYLIRIVWAYHKVISLILKSERKKIQGLILVITRLSLSPFSLLKWLVVPSHHVDHPDFENIVQHESIHSRQYHSVDLFLAEMLVAFQWFNPFAWWLKKSMVENHEFIVDQIVLQHGVDSRKYQYSLLNLSTGSGQLAGVNYFNANLIKKRIRMMNKTKSPKWYGLKNGMALLSMAIVVALTATFETKVIAQEPGSDPVVMINGKKSDMKGFNKVNPDNIAKIEVLKASLGAENKIDTIKVITKGTVNISNEAKTVSILFKDKDKEPLILLDGRKISFEEMIKIENQVHERKIIGIDEAFLKYGDAGKYGALLLFTAKQKSNSTIEEVKVVGWANQKTSSDTVDGYGPFVLKDPIFFPSSNYPKDKKPLVFLDDKKMGCVSVDEINSYKAHKVIRLDGPEATKKYGEEAKDGVMLLYTKLDSQIPGGIVIRNVIQKQPLIVVNGRVDPDQDMSKINANDISSIEVLKDQSATALYGDKGKNGVVKITLKSGLSDKIEKNLVIAPNPASDNIEVTLKGSNTRGMFDVRIFDKYGKLLVQDKKSGPTFTVSVAGLPTGAYVVAVTDGKNKYTGNLSVVH